MRKVFIFLVGIFMCHSAFSATLFGKVDGITGSAFMSEKNGKIYTIVLGQQVFEGFSINTTANGEVHIATMDGGFIALRPNTSFRVDEYKADGGSSDKIFMSLVKGGLRSITGWIGKRKKASYRVTTPTATIGIRGTDHETIVIDKASKNGGDEPGTYDTVKDGSTLLKTPLGEAEVRPGKFVFASKDKAPFLLAKTPKFFTDRILKIEARIQKRKEFLREHMDEMREERVKKLKQEGVQVEGEEEPLIDPTKPTSLYEQEDKPKPELQAVYLSTRHTAAVINGIEVKLGEKYDGATLTKIQDNQVTLSYPDGSVELIRMHPGVEKTLVNPAKRGEGRPVN